MSSLAQKDNTTEIEVSHVSTHGFWINIHGRNHFMAYEDFPWFRDLSVEAIANVVESASGTFHWAEVDVELTEAAIEIPEPFPSEAKVKNKIGQR